MTSRYDDGQGWKFVDNRASGGVLEEADLLGCGHCPKFMTKPDWVANGGYKCYNCHRFLCEECRKKPPQMKCPGREEDQISRALNENYRREQNAKILGI